MASSTVAVALLVVGLVIGAGFVYALAPRTTTTTTTVQGAGATVTTTVGGAGATVTTTVGGATVTTTIGSASALAYCGCTIKLGDLIDLTGSQAPYGVQQKVAIDKAITDVNAWLKSIGDTVQFAVVHEDTQTDPSVTLQKLQTLQSLGIKVTIGPQISAESSNALSYAQANNIVMLSPEATSPVFDTAAHPYLFLVAPTDSAGAAAESAVAAHFGAQAMIIINRHDTWGDPFAANLNSSFFADGGKAVDIIPYTPITSGTYDFTAQLTQAQNDLQTLSSQYGASHVVVVNAAFDEAGTLYLQAATSYPSLVSGLYITNDVDSGFTTIAGSSVAGHTIYGEVFEPTASPKTAAFLQYMGTQVGIGVPEPYAQTAYDAVWIAALTILDVGKYDGAAVNAALPSVASTYFGVSGWTQFDQYGCRTNTLYSIWKVTGPATNATWTQVGSYAPGGVLTFNP